jgi:hypothetical protein
MVVLVRQAKLVVFAVIWKAVARNQTLPGLEIYEFIPINDYHVGF